MESSYPLYAVGLNDDILNGSLNDQWRCKMIICELPDGNVVIYNSIQLTDSHSFRLIKANTPVRCDMM